MIKETLIREYVRRGGQLRRREARGLIKVDVNKTSKIWDLLSEMGCFSLDGGAGSSSPGEMPTPTVAVGSLPAEKAGAGGMDVDPALVPVEPFSGHATPVLDSAALQPTPSSTPQTLAAAATPTLPQQTTPSLGGKTLPSTPGKTLPPFSLPLPPPPPMKTPPPLPPSSAPEPMDGVVSADKNV